MALSSQTDVRLYQVGNTSSRKITEVKQLGPCTVSTWIGDHSSVEADAVVKNTVNSQERRIGAYITVQASGAKK